MIRNLTLAALAFAVLAGTIGRAAAQDYRYYDRDDYRYHRGYDRDGDRHYDFREGMQTARQIGFQDGAQVAREDSWRTTAPRVATSVNLEAGMNTANTTRRLTTTGIRAHIRATATAITTATTGKR